MILVLYNCICIDNNVKKQIENNQICQPSAIFPNQKCDPRNCPTPLLKPGIGRFEELDNDLLGRTYFFMAFSFSFSFSFY